MVLISSINDYTVRFVVKVLSYKMLCKMQPTQCTAGMVALDEFCAEGVQIDQSQFLLNELLEDTSKSQEDGKNLHYAWLLILISFIIWFDPPNYQTVDLLVRCRGDRQKNLWFTKNSKNKQRDNNIVFFIHGESLRNRVQKQIRLADDTVKRFRQIIKFWINPHYVMIPSRQDPQCQQLATKFLLN